MTATHCTIKQTLNTGATIPAVGLGTWEAREGEAYQAVKTALELGYRHIDTATSYENEAEVGRAVRDSGIPREEIFVTTKVASIHLNDPKTALENSVKKMGLDYVDLLLAHWPVRMIQNGTDYWKPYLPNGAKSSDHNLNHIQIWRSLENLPATGLVKAVGVSNYDTYQLEDLFKSNCKVVPAMNQVELHPYLPQEKLIQYCHSKGIQVTAFCPLGQKSLPVMEEEVVTELAKKYSITPGQVLISWAICRGTIAIPKSSNPGRLAQNLLTVDLSKDDIQRVTDISKKRTQRHIRPDYDGIPLFQDDDWYKKE